MLAVAAHCAELPLGTAEECDGAELLLADVLADARAIEPLPAPGRERANGLQALSRGARQDNHCKRKKVRKRKNNRLCHHSPVRHFVRFTNPRMS